jgi:hypothetical protein
MHKLGGNVYKIYAQQGTHIQNIKQFLNSKMKNTPIKTQQTIWTKIVIETTNEGMIPRTWGNRSLLTLSPPTDEPNKHLSERTLETRNSYMWSNRENIHIK